MLQRQKDTLLGCFSIVVHGVNTRENRCNVRHKLLDRFRVIANGLEPFLHPAIRSFIIRLHAIDPQRIVRSAEDCYMDYRELYDRQVEAFIQKNATEGYVSDVHTFCYLFSDLYRVHIYLGDDGQTVLTCQSFDSVRYYCSIRIVHDFNSGGYHLLVPKIRRASAEPGLGVHTPKMRLAVPQYHIEEVGNMVPPSIEGFRVHHLKVIGRVLPNLCRIMIDMSILRDKDWVYVFGNAEPIGCGGKGLKESTIHFFPPKDCRRISLIIAQSLEEADDAVRHETNLMESIMN